MRWILWNRENTEGKITGYLERYGLSRFVEREYPENLNERIQRTQASEWNFIL